MGTNPEMHTLNRGFGDAAWLDDALWYKSEASSNSVGCVEIAHVTDGQVALRNSRDRQARPHVFTAHEWACFLDGVRNGEFDLPEK